MLQFLLYLLPYQVLLFWCQSCSRQLHGLYGLRQDLLHPRRHQFLQIRDTHLMRVVQIVEAESIEIADAELHVDTDFHIHYTRFQVIGLKCASAVIRLFKAKSHLEQTIGNQVDADYCSSYALTFNLFPRFNAFLCLFGSFCMFL